MLFDYGALLFRLFLFFAPLWFIYFILSFTCLLVCLSVTLHSHIPHPHHFHPFHPVFWFLLFGSVSSRPPSTIHPAPPLAIVLPEIELAIGSFVLYDKSNLDVCSAIVWDNFWD